MAGPLLAASSLFTAGVSVFNYYHVYQLGEMTISSDMNEQNLATYRSQIETVQWSSLAAAITASADFVCRIIHAAPPSHHHHGHPHWHHHHPGHVHHHMTDGLIN
uniref:Uncharacterized protein p12-2 n=1 Tax=Hyposoter didymator TaxID=260305 RepID=D7P5P0_HYPDD|nr:unknown [Hyposoter didymator]